MSLIRYFLPAEWALQSGVMLTWPHQDTDWSPYLEYITRTFLELSATIAKRERLVIAAACPKSVWDMLKEQLSDSDMRRVSVFPCPSNDTWARDHGPITLLPEGNMGSPLILNFRFNGWGNKFPAEKDNGITRILHRQGAFNGTLIDYDDFVLEGGSIESDGKGTIMTTSLCLLAPNRNQPLSKDDIEQELVRRIHARRIIWIDHGRLIGDDTDGHIDMAARFAPNNTLLYIGCDDKQDPQYEELKLLEQQLKELRTIEGKPYSLKRLPLPQPIYYDGERLPASYANFLVINGAVIMPTYQQPDNDMMARKIIESAFPGREIVGIDATTAIRQHGSIHCLTMQLPEGVAEEKQDFKQ